MGTFAAYALLLLAACLEAGGDALVRLSSHELQGLADARLGQHIQIRRLFQLHGQGLIQSSVENRVAGGVHKIGEQDGIFFGECVRFSGLQEHRQCGHDDQQCARRVPGSGL